ncbi:MAG TPA: MAB_1171c family putative transporter [Pseudonocardiaceae bacterium]|nr:MAB_1171c family putative transporter [Pseudonocardiaceae bacterium]
MNLALLQAFAAFAGLLWTGNQLRRAPLHRGLWLVTASLGAAESVYLLGQDSVAAAINVAVGPGASKVPENIAVMTFHFLVIWFFLDAAGTPRSRIRREASLCAGACVALVAARFAIPPAERGALYSVTMASVPVRVFYLIPSLYVGYALVVEFRAAWRYSRLSEPPLRHGLWIIAAALTAKLVGGPLFRTTATVVNWVGHPLSPGVFAIGHGVLVTGIVAFPIGIVYSGLVGRFRAVGRWWRHLHDYRGLEPLWRLMYQAFPEDALHRVPTSRWRHVTTFYSMHRRYYRRVIECRDGLVRISPYLPRVEVAGGKPSTAAMRAQQLRSALRTHANELAPTGVPIIFAGPRESDLDADVAELLALSCALARPAPSSAARSGA